ncbi:MAG: 3-phosphoshikimate 1-carboxyvinyltransferase [Proteobacteria bacterium]|nr:MAG: 3-phosphoshikimate 1-carboxyvinyltransferase [Pseudomonadota bacterium]
MKNLKVSPIGSFDGSISDIAADKSISHRAAIFSLLSDKPTKVRNFLQAEDTLSTLKIVGQLGAKVEKKEDKIIITPPKNIKEPDDILDCTNSGTAMRLLMGFLSTKKGSFVLHGDRYLANRPMKRISIPLRKIGANINGRDDGNFSPICIQGKKLKAFKYESKIPSAQVKSAMILAALDLDEKSLYKEHELSRDHSERMLRGMGARIEQEGEFLGIYPQKNPLKPLDIRVPADPSSGFFFAVLVALIPNSSIVLKNILLNKTRIEAYKILQKMGLDIKFIKKEDLYDEVGDIVIKHSSLKGVEVSKNISWLIDEIPALSLAFAIANGKSVVKNAKELRVKESDRISSVVENLRKCGIEVNEFEDGFEVIGGELKGAKVKSYGDHRIAMSFIIAGLRCGMEVEDCECINTSFPNFLNLLKDLGAKCK